MFNTLVGVLGRLSIFDLHRNYRVEEGQRDEIGKKGRDWGIQAFVSFCRTSASARVSYGVALLLLWPIKGRMSRWGQDDGRPPQQLSPRFLDHSILANRRPPSPHPLTPSLTTTAARYCHRVVRSAIEGVAIGFVFAGNIVRGPPDPVSHSITLWDTNKRKNNS